MVNKVILMGNLTLDPEIRITESGQQITKIRIACSRKFMTQSGHTQEETMFVDCDSFGKTADNIGKHFKRGKPIFIEGRLRLDEWENQSGEKRSKILVVIERFTFIPNQNRDGNSAEAVIPSSHQRCNQPTQTAQHPETGKQEKQEDSDDIPY